ncbi:hypothetical protein KAU43_06840, partial [candidate division WOR-3 bacterium]|nr:hypothetical protein [candidate division WOR-3 bacterium]
CFACLCVFASRQVVSLLEMTMIGLVKLVNMSIPLACFSYNRGDRSLNCYYLTHSPVPNIL